ncbi:MAG: hypothetical protein ACOCUA_02835 [archaeon]
MAGQSGDGSADRVAVEGDAAEWIRERANAGGLQPATYLERVVAALRDIETAETNGELATSRDLAAIERRIEDLDDDVAAKIEDVRDRVVQVKRETDGKAPRDHDHEGLGDEVDALETSVHALEAGVEDLATTVDRVESRLERGFENYEEILQYLVDTTDDVSAETASLASALVSLRQSHRALLAREERRRRTEKLKATANRAGVTEATCESCGNDVTVALLSEPACPFCGSSASGVSPKRGFFGSATLETGNPPALEDADAGATDEIDDIVDRADEQSDDPPTVLDEDGSLVDLDETESTGPTPSGDDDDA